MGFGTIFVGIVVAVLALCIIFLLFWRFWFLRQPERKIPLKGIVSPASGKVVKVLAFKDGEVKGLRKGLLGTVRTITGDVAKEGRIVVIMLSPLDVHFQRAPVSGKVLSVRYSAGRFRNAVLSARELQAFENEKNEILFQHGKQKVKVVQVAGVLARRIRCDVTRGDSVRKGQVIGLINLGSQVWIVLPKKRLHVREGQRVIDGVTVIA